ncbi:MAG: hypothetical protein LUE27_01890 [Clostridia bacterium]|nr:hypothetical protein [Clostridia bacterium]
MMAKVDYKIYPSLLDKYQRLLDAEPGTDEEEKIERELLDAVNRVEQGPKVYADRGTCFNEIVDYILSGGESGRKDVEISRGVWSTLCENSWEFEPGEEPLRQREVYVARMNGFEFTFDAEFCESVAREFGPYAVPQYLCKGTIDTEWGKVELYGYADEIVLDKVYDLKTTTSYQFGKYERGWQRLVYPYCLVESGDVPQIASFTYLPIVLYGGTADEPVINGRMYREEYTYDHAYAQDRLRGMLGSFIGWLEANRANIVDEKVFGGEKKVKQTND